jgi:hypothetical protein
MASGLVNFTRRASMTSRMQLTHQFAIAHHFLKGYP